MDINSSQQHGVTEQHMQLPILIGQNANTFHSFIVILSVFALSTFAILSIAWRRRRGPPSLFDPIPFVYNTIQFVCNNERFLDRASKALGHVQLVKFYLFKTPVYLVSGQQNIKTLFAPSHKVSSQAVFIEHVFPNLYGMTKKDVQRFANDKSGQGRIPAPGSEDMLAEQRYWYGYHHLHAEYLSKMQHVQPVTDYFSTKMASTLDRNYTEWRSVSLISFCREEVAGRAIEALFGPHVFELNPDLLDAFWGFDRGIFELTLGLPTWMFPRSYRARDRYYSMIRKYLDVGESALNEGGPASNFDSEHHPGPRACRETVKWIKENQFGEDAAVGAMAMLMFALVSNTIPTTMWVILEIVKDPSLLQAVRDEINTLCTTNPLNGTESIHIRKISTLPLLQSIFTEVLRMRINFNLMRNVNETIVVDGITLRPGSVLQAPMRVAHYEEAAWGREGHLAADFWAERHITYRSIEDPSTGEITQQRVFAMAGRPTSFFPFGGGLEICPGRHMAKQEVLTTVALLVLKLDIELVGWTQLDGSISDREARSDRRFSGLGAVPPDRDLQMRWKRSARRIVVVSR